MQQLCLCTCNHSMIGDGVVHASCISAATGPHRNADLNGCAGTLACTQCILLHACTPPLPPHLCMADTEPTGSQGKM